MADAEFVHMHAPTLSGRSCRSAPDESYRTLTNPGLVFPSVPPARRRLTDVHVHLPGHPIFVAQPAARLAFTALGQLFGDARRLLGRAATDQQ